MIRGALLAVVLLLGACGGAVDASDLRAGDGGAEQADAAPCDKAQALDDYRAAHGEIGKVGQWDVSADCIVTPVLP